jgi:hypothetical protein
MPHFDFSVNLGNVLTLVIFVAGFWRSQVAALDRAAKSHLDLVERINRLETSLIERIARLEAIIDFMKVGKI